MQIARAVLLLFDVYGHNIVVQIVQAITAGEFAFPEKRRLVFRLVALMTTRCGVSVRVVVVMERIVFVVLSVFFLVIVLFVYKHL